MYFARFMMVTVFLMSWHTTDAAVYKCKNSDGQTSYSENPCAGDSPVTITSTSIQKEKTENENHTPTVVSNSNQENQVGVQAQNTQNSLQIGFLNIPKFEAKETESRPLPKSLEGRVQGIVNLKKLNNFFSRHKNLLVLTDGVIYASEKSDLTTTVISDNARNLNELATNLKIGFVNKKVIADVAINSPQAIAMKKKILSEFALEGRKFDNEKYIARRDEDVKKLKQQTDDVIAYVAKEEGYDLLLPFHPGGLDVIHVSNQVDITSKVKKKL